MTEYVEYLHEVFELFGSINSRRMFGGHGIFHQGLMIGLVADDSLYLKADKQSSEAFTALGLPPFQYEKRGKLVNLSYYLAPEEIFEDNEMAAQWAQQAYQAALRAKR